MKYQNEPLSKCDNIILEAKRVLLNEQLDRMANITLSQDISKEFNLSCKEIITNIEYYKGLPSSLPESPLLPEFPTIVDNTLYVKNKNFSDTSLENSNKVNIAHSVNMQSNNKRILRKYFEKWKNIKKHSSELREEKLNSFIMNLKNCQHTKPPAKQVKASENCKTSECFKNRYKSQKNIIEMQRSKIEEQNEIISELQMGIIREDLLKSIENRKNEIREIFSNCSEKIFIKAPLLKATEEREKMMIHSQKAPKTVQKMQQRAIERARYRDIILERKRLIEEERQRLLEEAIEKKKVLEEEERRRNLELINEQRKRELQLQKVRNERRQEAERRMALAVNFYHKVLVTQCFRKLLNNYSKAKENLTLAIEYYSFKQKTKIFKTWHGIIEAKYRMKYKVADAHFSYKALAKAFSLLKQHKLEGVRNMQVAEDLYDFRLISNTFIHWHRYVCRQFMIENKKMQVAIKHNNRRMLFQYFYQWKSLPVVLQLEKAKEEKKRKWRERVWEILPDYRPPEET